MKLLLDTHVALWWVNEYEKLSSKAKTLILNDENELYISIVSMWEIAIKKSLGKLTEFKGGVGAFSAKVKIMPVDLLPIKSHHVEIL